MLPSRICDGRFEAEVQYGHGEWLQRPSTLACLLCAGATFSESVCRIAGETRKDPERLALCLVKSRLIWPRVHAFLVLDDDGADVDVLRARRRMLQDATSPRRAISRRDKDEYLDTCKPGIHASCRRFLQVRGTSPSEEEDLDLCHRVDAAVAVTRERGMTNPVRLWRPEPSAVFVASTAAATGAAAAARPGNDGGGRGDDDDDERYFWTGFWTGTLHRSVDAISVRAAFETGTLLVPLDADDVLSCARAACGFLAWSKFSDYIGRRVLIASRDWRILSPLKEDHNVPYASPMQFRMTRCGSSPSSSSNCRGAVLVFPGRDSCDVSVTASLLPRRDDGSTPTRPSKSESSCATSAPRPSIDDRSCLSDWFVLPSSSRGGVYGELDRLVSLAENAASPASIGSICLCFTIREGDRNCRGESVSWTYDRLARTLAMATTTAPAPDDEAVTASSTTRVNVRTACSFGGRFGASGSGGRIHDSANDAFTGTSPLGVAARMCKWFRVRATAVLAASFGPVPAAATAGGRGVHNATMADAAALVGTWSPSSALRFFEAHATRDEARGKTAIVDKLRRAAVDTAGVRLALLFYCRCCEPFVAAQMTALRKACPSDAVVVAAAVLRAEDSLPHGITALVIAGGAGCVFSPRAGDPSTDFCDRRGGRSFVFAFVFISEGEEGGARAAISEGDDWLHRRPDCPFLGLTSPHVLCWSREGSDELLAGDERVLCCVLARAFTY